MSGESSLPAVIHRGVGNPFGPTVSSGMTGTISKVLDSASQAVDSTSKVLESGIKMDDNGQQQVQPSLVTVRRPQLTNYALNDANLGVKLGFHPALFTDNENDDW